MMSSYMIAREGVQRFKTVVSEESYCPIVSGALRGGYTAWVVFKNMFSDLWF